MANTTLLATNTEVVWGTEGITHASGIVDRYEQNQTSKEKTLPGPNGITKAVVKYDKTTKATLEVYAKPDATIPDVGDAITITGGITAGIVDSAKELWATEDFKKISIEITKYEETIGGTGGT